MPEIKVQIYVKSEFNPGTNALAWSYRTVMGKSHGKRQSDYDPKTDFYCDTNGAFIKLPEGFNEVRACYLGNMQAIIAGLYNLPNVCEEFQIKPKAVNDPIRMSLYQLYLAPHEWMEWKFSDNLKIEDVIPDECFVREQYPIDVKVYILGRYGIPDRLMTHKPIDLKSDLTDMERYAYTSLIYLMQKYESIEIENKLVFSSTSKFNVVNDILDDTIASLISDKPDHFTNRYLTENFIPDEANPECIYRGPIMKLHQALVKWFNQ